MSSFQRPFIGRGVIILLTAAAMLSSGCSHGRSNRSSLPSASKNPGKVNLLACRLASYGKFQEVAWTHLPSIGVRHIEMPVPATDQIAATREKLARHGLTVVMFTGKTDLSQPGCVDELAAQLTTCEKMGVKLLFLSAKLRGETAEVVCDRLKRAGEIARLHGVTITLETHPELATNAEVARRTMGHISHSNVRINFDTGNIYFYNEDVDAISQARRLMSSIVSVHLKETDGTFGSWHFPALGKGVVDFTALMRLFNEHHFYGPFIMELEGIKGVELDEEQTKQMVADSVAHMRSIAEFE